MTLIRLMFTDLLVSFLFENQENQSYQSNQCSISSASLRLCATIKIIIHTIHQYW